MYQPNQRVMVDVSNLMIKGIKQVEVPEERIHSM